MHKTLIQTKLFGNFVNLILLIHVIVNQSSLTAQSSRRKNVILYSYFNKLWQKYWQNASQNKPCSENLVCLNNVCQNQIIRNLCLLYTLQFQSHAYLLRLTSLKGWVQDSAFSVYKFLIPAPQIYYIENPRQLTITLVQRKCLLEKTTLFIIITIISILNYWRN